jgi:hypothetical protein
MGAKAQQDQYGNVGTDRGRQIANNWNLIAFGTLGDLLKNGGGDAVVGADGRIIPMTVLVRMTDDERMAVADAYLTRHGLDAEYGTVRDAQKAFKESHPLYAGYAAFQKTARDYPGGVPAFRDDLMRTSSPYRQYVGRLRPDTKKDPEAFDKASISMDAYLAAKGTKANVYAPDLSGPNAFPEMEMLKNMLGGGFGGGGKKYDTSTPDGMLSALTDKIADYETKMARYNSKAAQLTGGQAYDQIPAFFQRGVRNQLEARGIRKPGTPDIVGSYRLWVAMQEPGADTSPAAYVTWYFDYQAQGGTAA